MWFLVAQSRKYFVYKQHWRTCCRMLTQSLVIPLGRKALSQIKIVCILIFVWVCIFFFSFVGMFIFRPHRSLACLIGTQRSVWCNVSRLLPRHVPVSVELYMELAWQSQCTLQFIIINITWKKNETAAVPIKRSLNYNESLRLHFNKTKYALMSAFFLRWH